MVPAPALWVFAGPNGAGKTTLFKAIVEGTVPYVNADDIAVELDAPNGTTNIVRAGRIAVERRGLLLRDRENVSIETTLSGNSALSFMSRAAVLGYQITLIYVGIQSVELSAARVRDRVASGGHDVPDDAIVRRYPDSINRLAQALEIAHNAFIFDNSGEVRRLLLQRVEKATLAVEPNLPKWFRQAVPECYLT